MASITRFIGSSCPPSLIVRESAQCLDLNHARLDRARHYGAPGSCRAMLREDSNLGDSQTVPRMCTLRDFSLGPLPVDMSEKSIVAEAPDATLVDLLLASAEASSQAKDFETLSGRVSMMCFAVALGVEYATGSSIFSGIDMSALTGFLGVCFVAVSSMGAYAFASQGKRRASDILASGCNRLVDSAVDCIMEGTFFDDPQARSGLLAVREVKRDGQK